MGRPRRGGGLVADQYHDATREALVDAALQFTHPGTQHRDEHLPVLRSRVVDGESGSAVHKGNHDC